MSKVTEMSDAEIVEELDRQQGIHNAEDQAAFEASSELAAAMDATEPDEQPIMDLVELGRAFRALANARSRIDEIERTATTEKERIEHWRQQATESDRRTVTYFEGLIGAYALSRREGSKGHDKSLTTPYGRVETRDVPAEYSRVDADLLPWAKEHGYTVAHSTVMVDWARLKKDAERQAGGVLVLNGEVVPGVTVRDREPTVTVTPWA